MMLAQVNSAPFCYVLVNTMVAWFPFKPPHLGISYRLSLTIRPDCVHQLVKFSNGTPEHESLHLGPDTLLNSLDIFQRNCGLND